MMKRIALSIIAVTVAAACLAQTQDGGGVRRRSKNEKRQTQSESQVSDRMRDFYETKDTHDADLAYERTIYRELDLNEPENAPLYFPEDVIDGQKNLFRTMLELVVNEEIPAYEYLDGREVFTDQYKVNVGDMLDRFGIYYTISGSGKNGKYVIEEADVPTTQVQSFYIIEKWEFDRRSSQMKTRVEAICPVLDRYGDFGGEVRYPMFWVKFDALRPWLSQQYIFLSDDNNLAQYSIDDYFNLGMYKGDIYKTKNLRNQSLAQMFPDPDDLKQAQDSIDNRLRNFGKNLWVPTREEYLAQKEAEAEAAAARRKAREYTIAERDDDNLVEVSGDEVAEESKPKSTRKKRTTTPSSKKKKTKAPKVSSSSSSSSGNSNAAKSVRRRKK